MQLLRVFEKGPGGVVNVIEREPCTIQQVCLVGAVPPLGGYINKYLWNMTTDIRPTHLRISHSFTV